MIPLKLSKQKSPTKNVGDFCQLPPKLGAKILNYTSRTTSEIIEILKLFKVNIN